MQLKEAADQHKANHSKAQEEVRRLTEDLEALNKQHISEREVSEAQKQGMEGLQASLEQQTAKAKKLQQRNDELVEEVAELQQVHAGYCWVFGCHRRGVKIMCSPLSEHCLTPPPPQVGKPSMASECASGCTWSTARAAARLWDGRLRSSQPGQVIQGLR